VKRWLALSNELAKLGSEVHVLTLDPNSAEYSAIDEGLLDTVNERIHVHRISAWNPFHITKRLFKKHIPPQGFAMKKDGNQSANVLTALRSHLFIPDPRRTWNAKAIREALAIIDAHDIEAVITTSPPHSVHLIGRKIAQMRAIKWIADFRDPWTDIFYYKQLGHSWFSRALDRRFERSVLVEADVITTVSWGFKDLFERKVPERNPADIHVIPNGIDSIIADWKPMGASASFRLAYTGMLTDLYEIEPFLQALKDYNSDPSSYAVELDFYGPIPDDYRRKLSKTFTFLQFHGNRSMDEIPQIQESADGLFLVGPKDYNSGHIPGKIFEYLRASRPIFYLGDKGSDVCRILDETQSGILFDRSRTEHFQGLLKNQIEKDAKSKDAEQRERILSNYLRVNQAKEFLDIV